jgi:hypothetical protein
MARQYMRFFGDSLLAMADHSVCACGLWPVASRDISSAEYPYGQEALRGDAEMHASAMLSKKCELMAILAELESLAVCGERIRLEVAQLDFLPVFIVPAVRIFSGEKAQDDVPGFYRALGVLVREFVKFEENYLGVPEETDTS